MSQARRFANRLLRAATVAGLACGLAAPAASAADPAYGEYLSAECVACHRRDGQDKGIPSIVGWPPEQFVAVLRSYKTKDRPNQVMQTITGRLNDEDMAALAAFYGGLTPAR